MSDDPDSALFAVKPGVASGLWQSAFHQTAARTEGAAAEGTGPPTDHPGALDAAPSGPIVGDSARFEARGLLGVGGMARVRLGWDTRLRREVALKEPLNEAAAQRLAREAWITAQLEHPGIAPVYDAGEDATGTPWFAMRLVRGRSLAEILSEQGRLPAGDPLWRALLEVCEVIGYAHSRGVTHLDVKPDNIMLGAFGETVVLDWGIAAIVEGPDAESGPRPFAGTRAYACPEALEGAPAAPAHDVWGLGALLHEAAVGARPGTDPDTAALDNLNAPELAAIIRRALASDPRERYPDGAAVAADVAAWLDARPVAAHAYTAGQAVRRRLRAWRVPSVVGLVLLGVLLGMGALSAGLLVLERDRATRAEGVAAEHLQALYVSAARAAEARADRAAAETFASAALEIGPSPDARGVLARWDAQIRPIRLAVRPTPLCTSQAALTAAGPICARRDQLLGVGQPGVARWSLRAGDTRWAAAADADRLLMVGPQEARVVDARTGEIVERVPRAGDPGAGPVVGADGRFGVLPGRDPRWFRMAPLAEHPWSACASAVTHGAVLGDRWFAACADGAITSGRLDSPDEATRRHPLTAERVARLDTLVALDEARVLLIADGGRLALLDLARGTERALGSLPERSVAAALDGHHLVLADARGVELLDARTGARLLRLAVPSPRAVRLEDGLLEVVGARLYRWQLPKRPGPVAFRAPVGVMPARPSPDGFWIAAAGIDGSVQVWSTVDGRHRALDGPSRGAAMKWVEFTPDSTALFAVGQGVGNDRRFKVGGWSDQGPLRVDGRAARRVALLGDRLVFARYDGRLETVGLEDGAAIEDLSGVHRVIDLVAAPSFDGLLALTADGAVLRLTASGIDRWVDAPRGRHLAGAPDGSRWAVGRRDGVTTYDRAGRPVRQADLSGRVTDIALSDTLLAVGYTDGRVELRRTDDPSDVRARLDAHADQVGSVEFSRDGRTLVTSGWDGWVRRWGLDVLDVPAAEIAEATRSAWGHAVEELLADVDGI